MSDPKMTMEVSPQVRDFAVKSVDQKLKEQFRQLLDRQANPSLWSRVR